MGILGGKHSEETKRKISKSLKGRPTQSLFGEQNSNWKGGVANYATVHIWLRKTFGNPLKCENKENHILDFMCSGVSKVFQWAKLEGKEYTKERSNYIQLCKSCHIKYDMTQRTVEMFIKRMTGNKFAIGNKSKSKVDKTIIKNKYAVELGRLGGKSTSEKKKRASRLNGKKGGHPKKQ